MRSKSVFTGLIGVLVVAGLAYAAWHLVVERSEQICGACARHIHPNMRTVAILDGKRTSYCCPACALSEHQQSGRKVEVVELTDFQTGVPLKPATTVLVRNSDVNPCSMHGTPVGENSQPLQARFDRCSPSVLAFHDRASAANFAREHGGQVVSFADFASEYER